MNNKTMLLTCAFSLVIFIEQQILDPVVMASYYVIIKRTHSSSREWWILHTINDLVQFENGKTMIESESGDAKKGKVICPVNQIVQLYIE